MNKTFWQLIEKDMKVSIEKFNLTLRSLERIEGTSIYLSTFRGKFDEIGLDTLFTLTYTHRITEDGQVEYLCTEEVKEDERPWDPAEEDEEPEHPTIAESARPEG